jgi:hypothetical protein
MLDAMIAIVLMLFANLAITYARTKKRNWSRRLLSFGAFFMLCMGVVYAIRGLF